MNTIKNPNKRVDMAAFSPAVLSNIEANDSISSEKEVL